MGHYAYRARSATGTLTGTLEAPNRPAAIRAVQQMNVIPISLTETSGNAHPEKHHPAQSRPLFRSGIQQKEVTRVTRQLSTLLAAGFPLARALVFIQKQMENETFRGVISQINREVRRGEALSEALSKHPKVFNVLFVSMVEAGESAGILERLVGRLADMREADEALLSGICSALVEKVYAKKPAALAGVIPGDILLRIHEKPVHSKSEAITLMQGIEPDANVTLILLRDKKKVTLPVVLQPKNPFNREKVIYESE